MPPRDEREKAEAIVILGREIVEQVLADPTQAVEVMLARPSEVLEAIEQIRACLPDGVERAVEIASSLTPELRIAVAGAWAGGATSLALSYLEIEEEEDA